jgi:hypothetical protein
MLKLITSALVAGSLALTSVENASACNGGSCCKKSCAPAPAAACDAQPAAPTPPAAMPDMPTTPDAPPAPTTAQNNRTQYRSYSYNPAPAYRAPVTRSYNRPDSRQQNQFRADHKMRGY